MEVFRVGGTITNFSRVGKFTSERELLYSHRADKKGTPFELVEADSMHDRTANDISQNKKKQDRRRLGFGQNDFQQRTQVVDSCKYLVARGPGDNYTYPFYSV